MSVAGYKKGIKEVGTLQAAMGMTDYKEFYQTITRLVEAGRLIPTKGGKDTNGKVPPLAKKYRIVEEDKAYDAKAYQIEIKRMFPLKYESSYYKNHIDHYHKDHEWIEALLAYHQRPDAPLLGIMSINERIFDIFGHEKLLNYRSILGILKRLGLNESYLNAYLTPEPFIYYSKNNHDVQKILIVENKDTWYTVKRLLSQGLGSFDTVIYGEGKKIISSIEEVAVHQKSYYYHPESKYFYFGDLDDEGLSIYDMLEEKATFIHLELWEDAYHKILELGVENNLWRSYKAQRNMDEKRLKNLLSFLEDPIIDLVGRRFKENLYLPQEIVNYQVLRKMWQL